MLCCGRYFLVVFFPSFVVFFLAFFPGVVLVFGVLYLAWVLYRYASVWWEGNCISFSRISPDVRTGPCSIRLWKNITTGVFPPGVLMRYCFHPIAVGSLSRGTSSLSRNLIQQSAHRDSRRFFSLKCQLRWCFPMWAFMYFWVVSVGASGYPICFSPFPIFECFRPFPPPDVICFSFFCLLFWSLDLWFKKAARYVLAIFHLKR